MPFYSIYILEWIAAKYKSNNVVYLFEHNLR